MEIVDVWSVTMVRTDEGRRLRKAYDNHLIHHAFNEHREMKVRKDGISNVISTVAKDFLICEVLSLRCGEDHQ